MDVIYICVYISLYVVRERLQTDLGKACQVKDPTHTERTRTHTHAHTHTHTHTHTCRHTHTHVCDIHLYIHKRI